ncbi:glycoside hydrolase family 27 protein [Arenibacter sp. N53]|uniref:glycoside hydrolase family 27 protein n=1 Tax=Arenibacter TaxID=178469 RepID=UPI000CD46B42|nr:MULTISPECIES: glycoside hydrolase family 27 protein [Arenibacter]MCM4150113.1 glycoside hydrolase family 27 protein [Arenibacter sp. N53]
MRIKNLRSSVPILLSVLLLSCSLKTDQNSSNTTLDKPEIKEATRLPKPPIMGWASWNNYRVNINEVIIKSQADAMVTSGLMDSGYSFINVDDGFYGGRDENGNLLVHKERFPSGMKSLAEYIHAKGLKAGIYSDAGVNTCASYWDKDTIGSGMGLYGHDRKDLTLYLKEWKYDFIKVDWCGGEWLGLDEETRYSEIAKRIRAINPNVIFNVCRWKFPGKWVTQVADSWRISGDINNRFESILRIIDLNADLWSYSSAGHYNDMDMLQVGRGMTLEEDRTHFSMWCLMHSPLLLGNDLTTMSNETLKLVGNREMIALNQSPYVYQARRLIDYGELEVWAKPLIDTMSGEIAVGLLNRSDSPAAITFNLSDIGIKASEGYTIRDIWADKDYKPTTEETIRMEVSGHGIVVLKIKGKAVPFNVFQFKENNW